MIDRSSSQLLNLIQYSKEIVKSRLIFFDALAIAKELNAIDLAPSRLDLGRLAMNGLLIKKISNGKSKFIADKLKRFYR